MFSAAGFGMRFQHEASKGQGHRGRRYRFAPGYNGSDLSVCRSKARIGSKRRNGRNPNRQPEFVPSLYLWAMWRAAELALSARCCGRAGAPRSSEHGRAPESGDSALLPVPRPLGKTNTPMLNPHPRSTPVLNGRGSHVGRRLFSSRAAGRSSSAQREQKI